MGKIIIPAIMIFFSATGKDLGNFGATLEILEPDLLEQIYARLNDLRDAGKLETAGKDIQKIMEEKIKNPVAVEGLRPAKISRIFQFDPTIEVTRDLKDHSGKIFAKKGERFNPLNYITLSCKILFIDGSEEKHIRWAQSKMETDSVKIILVKGSPLELQKRLNCPIYFDQYGSLVRKIGIEQIPAMVFQQEKVLVVIEEAEEK